MTDTPDPEGAGLVPVAMDVSPWRDTIRRTDPWPLALAAVCVCALSSTFLLVQHPPQGTATDAAVLFAVGASGFAQAAFVVRQLARGAGIGRLEWIAAGYAFLAGALMLRSLGIRPGNTGVPALSANTLKWLLLEGQTGLAIAVGATVVITPSRARRSVFVAVGLGLVAATIALDDRLPALVSRAEIARPLLFPMSAAVGVLSIVAAVGSLAALRPAPRLVESWTSCSLLLGGWGMVLWSFQDRRFDDAWWAGTVLILLQALVPAIALQLGTRDLYRTLGEVEPRFRNRLLNEVGALLDSDYEHRHPDISATGRIRSDIADVLAAGEITTAFQPIVDLETGSVVGVEALARFPSRFDRSVEAWFVEADRAGVIEDLEMACARTALSHLDELPDDVYLSVNLGPASILAGTLPTFLTPDASGRVVLEVTERAGIDDYKAFTDRISTLRDAGLRLAVDDVGAGFANFRHILRLRPDIIKLDQSVTAHLLTDYAHRALVTAMATFAGRVGATVVAEAVEEDATAHLLATLGVRHAQGYRYGRPQQITDLAVRPRP